MTSARDDRAFRRRPARRHRVASPDADRRSRLPSGVDGAWATLLGVIAAVTLAPALPLPRAGLASAQAPPPVRLVVRGVEMHYVEHGTGEPVVLLHGGQGDYRAWQPHVEALAVRYRVISYSRRYHYPNDNALTTNHSALVDADDLAGLFAALRLGPAHLIGTSYGAFTALAFATRHPALVRSMVLAEPPVHAWVLDSAHGGALYRTFLSTAHEPAGRAFAAGRDEDAMRILVDTFDGRGTFDGLPADRRASVMANARFFKVLTASSNPFPILSRDEVGRLRAPMLIVRGADTDALHAAVTDELARLRPDATRVTIPHAGHGSPRQNPKAFITAVLAFLDRLRPSGAR